jgi:acetyl-CoA carboxylase biotin carboxyl carrier protein
LESGKSFAVKAPTVGIFYSRPEPSAPPFVDLGSKIAEGDTLCLIEVMKVFTAVVAPRSGKVRKILADNNSMVEHNQTLFLIDQNDD